MLDERGGYGNCIIINHGLWISNFICPPLKMDVKPGQKVKRGQVIGKVGNTGKSTAPHLHYEVLKE
jgi:murein DD-endopeptidase MepM/ murein hydrolase activator NlpD